MNRHTLMDVYLGLRADSFRAVTGAMMIISAAGAAEALIRPAKEKSESRTKTTVTKVSSDVFFDSPHSHGPAR